jgi:peptidyl-prolyl cis-trans isomerase D
MAKKNSAQNVVVWILMALLVVGLAGFGVDGFLSQRAASIGSVGSREISTQTYMRALQDAMRAAEREQGQAMPIARALSTGLDQQVRAQLVTQAALEAEADRIGIAVGDENVMRTVTAINAFRGPGGAFDRDTYRFALENAGLTPARFEDDVRREAARGILQAATAAGVAVPANLQAAVLAHFATRRDVSVFALDESALDTPPESPDQAAVEAYYTANLPRFTAPETRAITYAWVSPDMLLEVVEVDEATIRALYDQRAADFVRPERRLVERLVFPDQASADAAAARLAEGATFEDLVAERGLSLDDTDMGDVTQAQLGAAGEAVFALADPGSVTGPHRSNLGPAIFRMNAVLSAQETPFEDAAPALRDELAADRARRRISDAFDLIVDLLAGGASLEDLAAETDMVLGRIDWEVGAADDIAAYAEFRAAALAANADDFPEVRTLSDGGLFALRLDGVSPPAPRPLDQVRDAVEAGARLAALRAALTARAQALAPDLATQGAQDFSDATGLVPDTYAALTRLDRIPNLPPALLERIHAAAPGTTVIEGAGDQVFLALVSDQSEPDVQDAQTARLVQAVDAEIGGALAQDVFGYFARALEREAGIRFNQPAIDAAHAAFP